MLKMKKIFGCIKVLMYKLRYGRRLKLDFMESRKPIFMGRGVTVRIGRGSSLELSGGDYFEDYVYISVMDGGSCRIGTDVYMNSFSRIYCVDEVVVEKDCIFGSNVSVYDHNHIVKADMLFRQSGMESTKVTIGSNVWLGTNTVVLKGSSIAEGIVVGAGSVVNKSMDVRGVYAGNPAVIKREIERV